MFINVVSIRHTEGFKLIVEFDNGVDKEVDLTNELTEETYRQLKEPGYFEKAFVNNDSGTVAWPNGSEFSAEFLYEIGRELHRT